MPGSIRRVRRICGEDPGLIHFRSLVRGVALGVFPVMVGTYAVSGLTAPAGIAAHSRAVPVARVVNAPLLADHVRAVDLPQVLGELTSPRAVTGGTPPVLPVNATVTEIASAANLDAGTVRWANDLTENQEAAPGQVLAVPPGRGSLLWRAAGETPDGFAARTGIPMATLAAYNSHLDGGDRRYLQVPFGTVGAALASSAVVVGAPGVPAVASGQRSHGSNGFPFGQCTWFVASKRNVTWSGDAGQWLRAARGIRPEGKVPVVGAIAVQTGGAGVSSVGHVSYVQSLNPDGSFQVAEMNYQGLGVVDHRTMSVGRDGVSFIY